MQKFAFFIISLFCFSSALLGQILDDLDNYTVDEFYKKVDLNYGTLGEDGRPIDFVFVKTDLESGTYEIELTDGPGDLYEVKGTNIYIEFRGYFGYAGYGTKCILKVEGGYYSAIVYKLE
jgi:hypothetical protein